VHRLTPQHVQLYERHTIAGKRVPEGCAAFRVEGALFFGATDTLEQIHHDAPYARVVILQLHRLVLLDTTGLLALDTLYKRLQENNQQLVLCGAGAEVMGLLVGSQLAADMGERNLQPDLSAALMHAEELLTSNVVWG
jgi:SulP family sulfate permease